MVDARGRSLGAESRVIANFITPGWFVAYGIPIRAGRDFDDRATWRKDCPPIVSSTMPFARQFFPDGSAIGETFVDSENGPF